MEGFHRAQPFLGNNWYHLLTVKTCICDLATVLLSTCPRERRTWYTLGYNGQECPQQYSSCFPLLFTFIYFKIGKLWVQCIIHLLTVSSRYTLHPQLPYFLSTVCLPQPGRAVAVPQGAHSLFAALDPPVSIFATVALLSAFRVQLLIAELVWPSSLYQRWMREENTFYFSGLLTLSGLPESVHQLPLRNREKRDSWLPVPMVKTFKGWLQAVDVPFTGLSKPPKFSCFCRRVQNCSSTALSGIWELCGQISLVGLKVTSEENH